MQPSVILIGPLPPPLGGTTVLFRSLADYVSARDDIDATVINTVGVRGRGLRASASLLNLIVRIWRGLRGADVVSLHVATSSLHLMGPLVVMLARLRSKPVMIRKFGGTDFLEYGRLRRTLCLWALRRADLYLAETKYLVERARVAGLDRVLWHSNSRAMPELPELAADSRACRRFVFMGQIRSEKGVLELIAAGEKLEGEVVVDVFGGLGGNIDLQAFAGLSRVRYMGPLEAADVRDTLCRYDCLVLPSYYGGEGYPGVILEAYAAGLPVVATRWRAIPELIDDGLSGLLVEPRDPDSLLHGMLSLVEDGELCAHLRAGVREKRVAFSDEIWHEQFVEHCRRLARRETESSQTHA